MDMEHLLLEQTKDKDASLDGPDPIMMALLGVKYQATSVPQCLVVALVILFRARILQILATKAEASFAPFCRIGGKQHHPPTFRPHSNA